MPITKSPADQVIEKIRDSEPDLELTPEEIKAINDLYKQVKTPEGKKIVKDYIESKFTGEVQKKLFDLWGSLEIQIDGYSMDVLAQNCTSDFYNIILSNDLAIAGYKGMVIGSKIEKYIDFFPNGHETLNLIYWKKITDEIGLKTAGTFAIDKVGGFIGGIMSTIKNIGHDVETEGMDLSKMGDLIDELHGIGEVKKQNLTEKQKEKVMGIMGKLVGYIEHMTANYTKNLVILIELGKTNKDGLEKLLDNPLVLSEVLETGKTSKNGYSINLDNKEVIFAPNPDLVKSKKDFMALVVDSTNKNGKTLDKLKKNTKAFANIFKKIGFDSNELRDFRDGLKEIPFIGEFLYALVSFFLSDKVLNLMDDNPWDDEFKKSGKVLQAYVKKNIGGSKLPFTTDEKMFENTENSKIIEGFLGIVDDADKRNFDNIENNRKNSEGEKYIEAKRALLMNNPKFWEIIFGDKESTDPILEQIRLKTIELKKKKLSSKEFFMEMSKMKIGVIKAVKPLTEKEKKLKLLDEAVEKKISISDKAELSTAIAKITQFPTTITLKNKKELNIDFKDGKLLLNNKEFVLKEGELSQIKFEAENVVLKLKDNTEKTISISDFAIILAGLAVGETLNMFITQKEKESTLQITTQNQEQQVKLEENQQLNQELTKLTREIELLKTSIQKLEQKIKDGKLETQLLNDSLSAKKEKLIGLALKESNNSELIVKKELEINSIEKEENNGIFVGWLKSHFWTGKANILKKEIEGLKLINKQVFNDRVVLERKIKLLTQQILDLETAEKVKTTEFKKQTNLLTTKKVRVLEIQTKLGENTDTSEAMQQQIEQQKQQAIIDAAEIEKRKSKKAAERATLIAEIDAEKKESFEGLLKVGKIKVGNDIVEISLDENTHILQIKDTKYKIEVIMLGLDILTKISFNNGLLALTAGPDKKVLNANELEGTLTKLITGNNIEKEVKPGVIFNITEIV